MTDHFDTRETRSTEARKAAVAEALPRAVARARQAPAYAALLAEVDAGGVVDAEVLAHLPVTRKSELIRLQADAPPLGGFNVTPLQDLARVFASPGPIHEGQADGSDPWRFARALHATGLRRGMLLHNCFAYHFTPAGMMLESGARALGCPVFPAGPGNTEAQARAAASGIRDDVVQLALLAAEKVSRRSLSDDEHRKLIEQAIDEADLSALAGNGAKPAS